MSPRVPLIAHMERDASREAAWPPGDFEAASSTAEIRRGQNWKGRVWRVTAMSQREVVWIFVGAVLIGAAGAGAFVVATYALSLF